MHHMLPIIEDGIRLADSRCQKRKRSLPFLRLFVIIIYIIIEIVNISLGKEGSLAYNRKHMEES